MKLLLAILSLGYSTFAIADVISTKAHIRVDEPLSGVSFGGSAAKTVYFSISPTSEQDLIANPIMDTQSSNIIHHRMRSKGSYGCAQILYKKESEYRYSCSMFF